MKINYHCEMCGVAIAAIDVPYDEVKLGFDCLTSEERKDIISMDYQEDTLHVKALCDSCIVGIDDEADTDTQMTIVYTGKQIIH